MFLNYCLRLDAEREIWEKLKLPEVTSLSEFWNQLKAIEERLRWVPLRLYCLQTMKDGADVIGEEAKNNVIIEIRTRVEELSADISNSEGAQGEIFEMIEYIRKRIIY